MDFSSLHEIRISFFYIYFHSYDFISIFRSEMSTQSLTELKRTPKYCTNTFSEHGTSKSSDLRWVTEDQDNKYPSKVSLGQKICSKCRKKLAKLPCESRSLELTLPEGSSCKEMVHDQPIEEHYEEFIDPDTEMNVLNTM